MLCVPKFVASIYQKVTTTDIGYMTYICFFFVLYWFALFLKFGPLPSENPRCMPGSYIIVFMSCVIFIGLCTLSCYPKTCF